MSFRIAKPDTVIDPHLTPIVIMHGLLGSKNNWNSLANAISSKTHKKVYTVDARNHGESPHTEEFSYAHLAEDVKFFLENEKLNTAHLLGHSMGGRAMMYFALKYPHLVGSLIVVDISPITASPTLKHMSGLFDAMKSVNLSALAGQPLHAVRKAVDKILAPVIEDIGVRQFILTNLKQADKTHATWQCNLASLQTQFFKHMINFTLPRPNATYDGPVLFIKGYKSDFIKVIDYPGILALFPKVDIASIADAGHWVHAQKPEEFVKEVVDFYNRLWSG